VTPFELDRIVGRVKAELALPGSGIVQADKSSLPAVRVKLVITQYDKGNAFARFTLAGLGQIMIGGDVIVVDESTGQSIGTYHVLRRFAFGGKYGAETTIEDVEFGFAASVAAVLKPKRR
jgi:hypothetical protein